MSKSSYKSIRKNALALAIGACLASQGVAAADLEDRVEYLESRIKAQDETILTKQDDSGIAFSGVIEVELTNTDADATPIGDFGGGRFPAAAGKVAGHRDGGRRIGSRPLDSARRGMSGLCGPRSRLAGGELPSRPQRPAEEAVPRPGPPTSAGRAGAVREHSHGALLA